MKNKIFKRNKTKKFFLVAQLVFLLIAIVAGIILIGKSQDIRGRASGNCGDDRSCGFLLVSGSYSCTDADGDKIYCCPTDQTYSQNGCLGGCDDDSDCKNDRKCQNGRCIGNVNGDLGGFIFQDCGPDYTCPSGKKCSIRSNKCIPKYLFQN